MKVALLTLDFPPGVGGVQRYLFEVAQGLAATDDVVVVTPTNGALPAASSFRRLHLASAGVAAWVRALRSERCTHVVVGHAHPRLLLAAALARRGRYACIAHGNDYLAAQGYWHKPLFNRLLGAARPLITVSDANAQRLQKLGLSAPLVIRPGTDPQRFMPAATERGGAPVLLTIARLITRKGIDLVLRTLPALLVEFPALRYHVAGAGPEQSPLEALATSLNIAHAVRFLGAVTDDEIPVLYRSADIFVLPTRDEGVSVEGFGIAYLEASASGLPVVAARSGGAVDAVRDGESGLLVPPDDPGALTEALRNLLRDPLLRAGIGQNGRRWIEEEMNWARVTRELAAALRGSDAAPHTLR